MERTTHKQVKNLVHNELAISKDDIRMLFSEEFSNILQQKLDNLFQTEELRTFIATSIAQALDKGDYSYMYGNKRVTFQAFFEKEVVSQIKSEVQKRINFNINVDIEKEPEVRL